MSKSSTIIKGLSWVLVQNIINILYGILAVPFLVNYFGKDEYGIIGMAISVNAYTQILDMGFAMANVKMFAEYIEKGDEDRLQRYFSFSHLLYLLIGLINTIVILLVAQHVPSLFQVSSDQAVILKHLLWILAANSIFSWISVCFDQFLKAHEYIDWIAKRQSLLKILLFAFLSSVIIFNLSIETYFFGYVFIATIILPLTIIKARRIEPKLKFNFRYDKEMALVALPYFLSFFSFGIFQFLASSSRSLFIGGISGPTCVAEFSVMSTITSVVVVFTGTFTQVLLPIVSKMKVSGDINGLTKIVNQGTRLANIFLTLIVFSIIISCNELINVYVGQDFINIEKWLILWLLMLLLSHRNVMTSLVFAQSELRPVAVMGGIAMCIALVAYIILIPYFGVGGAVIGYFIHDLIHTCFYYFYYFPKYVKINVIPNLLEKIIPTWVVAMFLTILLTCLFNNLVLNKTLTILLKSGSFAILFCICAFIFLLTKEDKLFILNRLKR